MTVATKETIEVEKVVEVPSPIRSGGARMRELTPAQRRAVMFAQQQVLRARAAKKAKDERQAALARMWQEEDAETNKPRSVVRKREIIGGEVKEVSLREAIGHVLRDLRTRDHKTLREVSEKAGVSLGYLSEVERGQKEASSELLASISESLGLSTSQMLRLVADYLDSVEA
ncbi:helix-turn-helix domain-containing protein [Bifidobacterium gallicum]|uniref:DNA-binding helix-turn-helix protein n=1 Tax=Bifidobacterium gallicum DSM 20093 = LMG 11596 TaxID=561180 RepID=D1NT64_9BIFI|nr:helix-turn-helix transcriptional regulator [Bifidobacterium gallicum]EFA23866.1 DNA-binding helix-turn-helix protein [Bifidobacterium gallicum DSM 20093 = LMG 11596]KFI59146.1 XRE family transcriptional regulator [Bifidobacterium gallicum DSM 20093 = LMG 11596]